MASNVVFMFFAFVGIYLNVQMHKLAKELFVELERKGFFTEKK